MLNISMYREVLSGQGKNLAQVRRKQSDNIINSTFTGDPTYKRVRVLTSNGWSWQDAKYQKHTTPSILKDEVDYYLQFRPGIHFKLGTYVIVPDDTSPEINTPENPFEQPVNERTQWWLIVGRTDANAYVRYSILKANYDFKWIYNSEILHCYGCVRNANSYTSCMAHPFVPYTARCIRKRCSVFHRICWNLLRVVTLKRKDEIGLHGKFKKLTNWKISRECSNRAALNDYQLKYC